MDEIVQFNPGNGVYDHGFDPPKDSGRGTGSLPGGYNRNDILHLQQNHMFDIEEDAEDQLDQHYQ